MEISCQRKPWRKGGAPRTGRRCSLHSQQDFVDDLLHGAIIQRHDASWWLAGGLAAERIFADMMDAQSARRESG